MNASKQKLSTAVCGATAIAGLLLLSCAGSTGQVASTRQPLQTGSNQTQSATDQHPGSNAIAAVDAQAEDELRQGTAMTRKGMFSDAIPHLTAARGRVSNEYAASFNLALCYLGIRDFKVALTVVDDLRRGGHDGADVENLLAQAYIGNGQQTEAFAAFQKAASIAPQNEKIYLFIADACEDEHDYALGIRIVDAGLKSLPQSASLRYERAMLLSLADEFDRAKADFDLAGKIAPGSEVAYLSASHEALFAGNIPEAIRTAREGIGKGFQSPALFTILGEALLRSGVSPGQPGFAEAQGTLERAVEFRTNDPSSQLALGQIYLLSGRLDDAIARLEHARQLNPGQPSVYANLAKAYQRRGDQQAAQKALATLAQLNQAQEDGIRSAPGDRKASYGGAGIEEQAVGIHP
jgi:tetratricopeptide (TPR) repeat protein